MSRKLLILLLVLSLSTGIAGCGASTDTTQPPTKEMVTKFVERMDRVDKESADIFKQSKQVEEDLRAGTTTIPQARKLAEGFQQAFDFYSVQMDMLDASGELVAVRDLYKEAMTMKSDGMEAYRDYLDHWDAPFGKQADSYFTEADKKLKEAKDRMAVIQKNLGS